MSEELSADQVRKRCAPSVFDCASTEELEPIQSIIGQDRALSALKFGLNIPKQGFNIFVSDSLCICILLDRTHSNIYNDRLCNRRSGILKLH